MSWTRLGMVPFLTAAISLCGCGGPPSETDEAPAGSAGSAVGDEASSLQAAREADAEQARRQVERERDEAAREAASTLRSVRDELARLRERARPALTGANDALATSLDEIAARLGAVENDIDRMRSAAADTWRERESEVAQSLDGVDSEIGRAREHLQSRLDVLERRDEQERKPVTGLFEALDGGDYEAYRVSIVREVQRALERQGYYPGPADGFLGIPTMEAIARFQSDCGVVENGVPTPETRERLL